jgi:hypothetical protein
MWRTAIVLLMSVFRLAKAFFWVRYLERRRSY